MAGLRQETQGLESMTQGLSSMALRKVRSPPLGKMMARSDILESSRKTLTLLQSHFYELCETPFHPQTLNKVCVPNCVCSDGHIHAHIVYIHRHYYM